MSDEQTELLREMVRWMRFNGMKQVKEVLTSTLNTEKKIIAYHHSDGKNTSRDSAKLSGISQSVITELWKEWLSLGLGETISTSGGGRFKRSFDLKMFGIVVPETKEEESEQKALPVGQSTQPTPSHQEEKKHEQ